MATQSLRAAVVAGGVLIVLCGVACIIAMPETGFHRSPRAERGHALRELKTTAGGGLRYARNQPLLLLLLAIAFFAGMSTETLDRLWEAHFIRDVGLPTVFSLDPSSGSCSSHCPCFRWATSARES